MAEKKEHQIERLVDILEGDSRSYFIKFIDAFFELHELHQKGILDFIVESIGIRNWERDLEDPFKHMVLVKKILFHYSGNEDRDKDPNPKHLAKLLEDYYESPGFDENERIALGGKVKKTAFMKSVGV